MVGEHHQLNGHKSEQTQGDREGQGSLGMLRSMGSQSRTRLNELIDTNLKSRKTLETYIYIYDGQHTVTEIYCSLYIQQLRSFLRNKFLKNT